MNIITAIMGKSSSGKDTIFSILKDDPEFNFQKIVPYTTRPIRTGERQGVEYNFVNEDEFQDLLRNGMIIEHRSYDTIHGIWRYFTANDDQFKGDDNSYIMICTIESYTKLRSELSDYKFIPIYIDVDDGERLQRALNRERLQSNPKYTEMCRRFIQDDIDFSMDKVEAAGIHKIFVNIDLDICINEIKDYIRSNI